MPQPAESSAEQTQPIPSPRATPPTSEPLSSGPASVGPAPSEAVAPGSSGAEREAAAALSERDELILAFEAKWWKHAGSKEQAIRDTFGLSSTRYYQLLNGLLDNPAAMAKDPMLVGRLRRLRSTRARTRRR